jgi:hypothetical protein
MKFRISMGSDYADAEEHITPIPHYSIVANAPFTHDSLEKPFMDADRQRLVGELSVMPIRRRQNL